MEKVEKYRDYNKIAYLTAVVTFIIGLLLFLVPTVMVSSASDGTGGTNLLYSGNILGTITGIGVLLLIAETIGVMIYDWQGVITIRGAAKRQILHKGKLVSTAPSYFLLYVFVPEIMLPIYLIRVARDFRKIKERKQLETRQQIAVMEAQLGILPAADGICRSCKKPLQVGAEFCSYLKRQLESVLKFARHAQLLHFPMLNGAQTAALPSLKSSNFCMVYVIFCLICATGGQHPPALLILGHPAQAQLFAREAAPLLLFARIRTDAVSIECFCPSKNLLATGAL